MRHFSPHLVRKESHLNKYWFLILLVLNPRTKIIIFDCWQNYFLTGPSACMPIDGKPIRF